MPSGLEGVPRETKPAPELWQGCPCPPCFVLSVPPKFQREKGLTWVPSVMEPGLLSLQLEGSSVQRPVGAPMGGACGEPMGILWESLWGVCGGIYRGACGDTCGGLQEAGHCNDLTFWFTHFVVNFHNIQGDRVPIAWRAPQATAGGPRGGWPAAPSGAQGMLIWQGHRSRSRGSSPDSSESLPGFSTGRGKRFTALPDEWARQLPVLCQLRA